MANKVPCKAKNLGNRPTCVTEKCAAKHLATYAAAELSAPNDGTCPDNLMEGDTDLKTPVLRLRDGKVGEGAGGDVGFNIKENEEAEAVLLQHPGTFAPPPENTEAKICNETEPQTGMWTKHETQLDAWENIQIDSNSGNAVLRLRDGAINEEYRQDSEIEPWEPRIQDTANSDNELVEDSTDNDNNDDEKDDNESDILLIEQESDEQSEKDTISPANKKNQNQETDNNLRKRKHHELDEKTGCLTDDDIWSPDDGMCQERIVLYKVEEKDVPLFLRMAAFFATAQSTGHVVLMSTWAYNTINMKPLLNNKHLWWAVFNTILRIGAQIITQCIKRGGKKAKVNTCLRSAFFITIFVLTYMEPVMTYDWWSKITPVQSDDYNVIRYARILYYITGILALLLTLMVAFKVHQVLYKVCINSGICRVSAPMVSYYITNADIYALTVTVITLSYFCTWAIMVHKYKLY